MTLLGCAAVGPRGETERSAETGNARAPCRCCKAPESAHRPAAVSTATATAAATTRPATPEIAARTPAATATAAIESAAFPHPSGVRAPR
ncbi:MAG: hypothetical protein M0C28_11955 [Candidatus Moduliflexus flocculans]|nr:hypothetical protein [Candidatus Moduliflexus flocculans]